MPITVSHQPNLATYGQAIAFAARQIEMEERRRQLAEFLMRMQMQQEELAQRERASKRARLGRGGGGGRTRRSDPTGIGYPGSLLGQTGFAGYGRIMGGPISDVGRERSERGGRRVGSGNLLGEPNIFGGPTGGKAEMLDLTRPLYDPYIMEQTFDRMNIA